MNTRAHYTTRDIAAMLGTSVKQFYKTRRRRELLDHMPQPVSPSGNHVYDKASFDAWYARHHPQAPAPALNDNSTAPAAATLPRQFLHAHYADRSK